MNIEKLEAILQEMRNAPFSDLAEVDAKVRGWADRIDEAITEHLFSHVGGVAAPVVPAFSSEPSGHGWDDDGKWRPE